MKDQSGSVIIAENTKDSNQEIPLSQGNKASEEIQKASDTENAKLDALVEMSGNVLFEAKSVFPLQLFPDQIIVEPTKITVIHKALLTKSVFPINIQNLTGVVVHRGILFASLMFEITGFDKDPGNITHLWPQDAVKAKRYIMGLIHAYKQDINLTLIPPSDLKTKIEEIGASMDEADKLL